MADYEDLITAIIKKFTTVVKRDTIIKVANGIDGLELDDEGNVISLTGDGRIVFEELYQKFKEIGGGVAKIFAKQAVGPIVASSPGLEVPEELK